MLYALQQRDLQGQKRDSVAVRTLARAVVDVDTLATTPRGRVAKLGGRNGAMTAYARMPTRIVHLAFEQVHGIVHTDQDVWDCPLPRRHRR